MIFSRKNYGKNVKKGIILLMENTHSPALRHTAGNENTGLIKLMAIVTMIIDHVGAAILTSRSYILLRYIGRLAMPLFCWCMVVGVCKSRNMYRYALRVLLVGIISQPFYMLALSHEWTELNVYATLFLGLCALIGIREKKYYSHLWAPVIALVITHFVKMDYGTEGVLLIIGLYLARNKKWAIAAVMGTMCLWWWLGTPFTYWLRIQTGELKMSLNSLRYYVNYIQVWAIAALPVMLLPTLRRSFRLPKWFGYAAYPGHLLIIYLVDRFLL